MQPHIVVRFKVATCTAVTYVILLTIKLSIALVLYKLVCSCKKKVYSNLYIYTFEIYLIFTNKSSYFALVIFTFCVARMYRFCLCVCVCVFVFVSRCQKLIISSLHHNFHSHGGLDPFRHVRLFVCPSRPCLLYTSPSPRDRQKSRMPSSA